MMILSDQKGVETSLVTNLMLTYYVTILILLGFFVFSKVIFYILFFIFFCPCISVMLCSEIHEEYKNNRRAKVNRFIFFLCNYFNQFLLFNCIILFVLFKTFYHKKLKTLLVEENYCVVEKRLGVNLESCCICSNDYQNDDKVITLPCNNK